jgi:hypothetical protein
MKNYRFPYFYLFIIINVLIFFIHVERKDDDRYSLPRVRSVMSPHADIEDIEQRDNYIFNMLKDPFTNIIPRGIRTKEIEFAEKLSKNRSLKRGVSGGVEYNWSAIGPYDIGGRTRAIEIDKRNSDIILAGGVSGGLWKSIDKGKSWVMTNNPGHYMGVTSITQDSREGHQDVWYYATGEYKGNSATDMSSTAYYYGNGVYKSTDNGNSWSHMVFTEPDFTESNSPYKYISKIIVNPVTGTVFICSNSYGIFRKRSDDITFKLVLGYENGHKWSDIDIDNDGNIIAYVSKRTVSSLAGNNIPGLYMSVNDGSSWNFLDISESLPESYDRGIIKYVPSDNNIAYLYLVDKMYKPYLYKINLSENTIEDRTDNIRFSFKGYNSYVVEKLGKQGVYNMTLAIKPDDPEYVILGATSLFRSNNGFNTIPEQAFSWIGGYGSSQTENFLYPNHHPDIHTVVFDPNNTGAMWCGHDGGISYTEKVNYNGVDAPGYMEWESKNNGYINSQFYDISIPMKPNSDIIMGGTQDNGTPKFAYNSSEPSVDKSSGDGSYCHFGEKYYYVSSQNGRLIRINTETDAWALCYPKYAYSTLFIHPFAIDPDDDKVIYYPSGNKLFVNKNIDAVFDYNITGTTRNWIDFEVVPEGYKITTLASSRGENRVIYIGAYKVGEKPLLFKVVNPLSDSREIYNISSSSFDTNTYPHDISVNPTNRDELMVIISNYNAKSIFYSDNGGSSMSYVEGNLKGDSQLPGPSVRCACFAPATDKTQYYVGTSTGLYFTENFNGDDTYWEKVSQNTIGNVTIADIEFNHTDNKIAVGTHGRGIFIGKPNVYIYATQSISDYKFLLNTESELSLDLASYFGGAEEFKYSISDNTNPELLTPTVKGNNLVVKIKPDVLGSGDINVRAYSNDVFVSSEFNITTTGTLLSVKHKLKEDNYKVNQIDTIQYNLNEIFEGSEQFAFNLQAYSFEHLMEYTITPENILQIIVPENEELFEFVVVRGTIPNSQYIECEFRITIEGSLDISVKENIRDYKLRVNQVRKFSVGIENVFTGADAYTYEVFNSNKSLIYAELDGNSLDFTITPDYEGESTITLRATNFRNYAETSFKIAVSGDMPNDIHKLSNKTSVYPNPATNHINISIPDYKNVYNNLSVAIINSAGVVVKDIYDYNNPVDISILQSGIYYIRIADDENQIIKSFIKL